MKTAIEYVGKEMIYNGYFPDMEMEVEVDNGKGQVETKTVTVPDYADWTIECLNPTTTKLEVRELYEKAWEVKVSVDLATLTPDVLASYYGLDDKVDWTANPDKLINEVQKSSKELCEDEITRIYKLMGNRLN